MQGAGSSLAQELCAVNAPTFPFLCVCELFFAPTFWTWHSHLLHVIVLLSRSFRMAMPSLASVGGGVLLGNGPDEPTRSPCPHGPPSDVAAPPSSWWGLFISRLVLGLLSPKVETTQVSLDSRMGEQNVLYPCKGILCSLEKERNSHTCHHMEES